MSFLAEVQKFSKSRLRATSTEVSTVDGRRLLEKRDADGRVSVQVLSSGDLGYIGDVKPDLQVGEILDGLILGSQDVCADLDVLRAYKVTHILNVASLVDNIFPDQFTYMRLNILDLPETDITQFFNDTFEFIDIGRQAGCVLVHCNAGISRSASIIIGYLMKKENMDFAQAFDLVKSKRPSTRPNLGFYEQLKYYQPHD